MEHAVIDILTRARGCNPCQSWMAATIPRVKPEDVDLPPTASFPAPLGSILHRRISSKIAQCFENTHTLPEDY